MRCFAATLMLLFVSLSIGPSSTFAEMVYPAQNEVETSASKIAAPISEGKRQNSIAPYCGIQAVCLAARSLGHEVDFAEIVQPKYLGSKAGSSLAELQELCKMLGLKTRIFKKLTVSSLFNVTHPLILHTTYQSGSGKYNHWILFTGIEDGKARTWKVVDGEATIELINLCDLAARWDGGAMMVSENVPSQSYFIFCVWLERFFLFALLILFIGLLASLEKYTLPFKKKNMFFLNLLGECGLIFFVAVLLFTVSTLTLFPGGFLSNHKVITQIKNDHIVSFFPKVSIERVKQMAQNNSIVLVDARLESQFKEGHIEGAINIPYTMSVTDTAKQLDDIPKDAKIVIVYEPFSCARAADVFLRITDLGYYHLNRFEDGWNQWMENEK